MTMAPDPHTPHPTRPFEDPPAYRRYPIGEPPRRRPTWRATAFAVVWIVLKVATFLAALAAVCLAILLLAGDTRTINAWGLWFRGIIGG